MMARQLELVGTHEVMGHGGRRKGAGRKPGPGRRRHEHRARPFHDRTLPVHVVLRVTGEVGRLRRRSAYQAVRSTGVWFPSWAERDGVPFVWPKGYEPLPCRAPTTWLLKEGWKRGRAAVSVREVPGGFEQMVG